jgi:hypothetical protein
MRMRMLHIRNMHQMASAAISPLHEDCPARPRLPGNRAWRRSPSVYHPFFLPYSHYFHYFPLLATSTSTQATVIGPPLGMPARPGKRPTPAFQNAKRSSVRVRILVYRKRFVRRPSARPTPSRNSSAASVVQIDPSKIHPIGENFPLRRRRLHLSTDTTSHDHLIVRAPTTLTAHVRTDMSLTFATPKAATAIE